MARRSHKAHDSNDIARDADDTTHGATDKESNCTELMRSAAPAALEKKAEVDRVFSKYQPNDSEGEDPSRAHVGDTYFRNAVRALMGTCHMDETKIENENGFVHASAYHNSQDEKRKHGTERRRLKKLAADPTLVPPGSGSSDPSVDVEPEPVGHGRLYDLVRRALDLLPVADAKLFLEWATHVGHRKVDLIHAYVKHCKKTTGYPCLYKILKKLRRLLLEGASKEDLAVLDAWIAEKPDWRRIREEIAEIWPL